MELQAKLTDHANVSNDFAVCDDGVCPVHGGTTKKVYGFGSSMTAETEVHVFRGCRCAVAVRHDPIGILPAVATYHISYENASGVGRLHALEAAAKYR